MPKPSLREILAVLDAPADPDKPWMTATRIAARMGDDRIQARQVEATLLEAYTSMVEAAEDLERNPPAIRYSSLPSRRTLEVLWAMTKRVGSRELSKLTKEDESSDALDLEELTGKPCYFFSHSHRDHETVVEIARRLVEKGVHPWLAETHIEQKEMIHSKIISALRSAQGMLLYLSENALRSRWTEKEFLQAVHQAKPIHVIFDARSAAIRKLVRAALEGDWSGFDAGGVHRWECQGLLRRRGSSAVETVRWYAYPVAPDDFPGVESFEAMDLA